MGMQPAAVGVVFIPLVSLNDAPAVTWFADDAKSAITGLYFSIQQALNDVDVTALQFDMAYSRADATDPVRWHDENGEYAWDYIVDVLTKNKPELLSLFCAKTGILVNGREGARD